MAGFGAREAFSVGMMAGLAACTGGSSETGAWALRLTPNTHPNQIPFQGSPEAKLLLRRSIGDEVIDLGTVVDGGELQAPGLPAADEMADVLSLGLAIQQPGGMNGAIDANKLTSYGEATFDLAAVEVPVLVSELDRIGDLGSLPELKQRFLRVVGLVPPGKVYMLTGSEGLGNPTTGSTPTADVFELTSLDGGEPWTFEKLDPLKGTLNPPERVSAAASSVQVGDKPMILVTGGRTDFWLTTPGYNDWFLWDPETHEVADKGELSVDRSEHWQINLANGKVLVGGGWTPFDDATADLIDPSNGQVTEIELGIDGGSGNNGAAIGADGALICGGFTLNGNNATAASGCAIVNFQGVARPVAPLPVPLAKFAMAPAGEGFVLATGGISWSGSAGSQTSFPALSGAYLYDVDKDEWTELNPLNEARSAAVGLPLANGRVLVVGGTASDGVLLLPDLEVECPEVYNPQSGSFTLLDDQCGSWGAGAAPPVARWPGLGTVLLKGYTQNAEPQDAVGFLGDEPNEE